MLGVKGSPVRPVSSLDLEISLKSLGEDASEGTLPVKFPLNISLPSQTLSIATTTSASSRGASPILRGNPSIDSLYALL